MSIFTGNATAMITPFNEKGIDFDAFASHIEFQIENGTSALVVAGTTGEPATMTDDEKKQVCRQIGEIAGKLHGAGIVHGDLTTSNILLDNGQMFLIDFSLGEKSDQIEAPAVDLHLVKEAFQSAHSQDMDMFEILLDGYSSSFDGAGPVIAKLDEIEKRGRYH